MTDKRRKSAVETIGKWIAIAISLGTFVWGVKTTLETRAADARRPFLDLQLKLYQEASEVTACMATSKNQDELAKAEARFLQLYWGELSMVENGGIHSEHGGVEGAMVRFKKAWEQHEDLAPFALDVAHSCRNSLAVSWDVPDWKAPLYSKEQKNDR